MQRQIDKSQVGPGRPFSGRSPLVDSEVTNVITITDLRTRVIDAALAGTMDRDVARDVLAAIPKEELLVSKP